MMKDFIKNFLNQIQKVWGGLDKKKRLILAGVAGVVFIGLVFVASFSTRLPRVLLYGDLNQGDYAKITKTLDAMSYSWHGSGTDSIYVDSSKRQAIITRLAQDNLIPAGVEGYDIFDISRWDETSFDKNIKLHRAIKGSLEQMLMTLDFVKKARVELAIPVKNNFMTQTDKVKASVVIRPTPGIDKVTRKQVSGIKNLIYRSVPGLDRENITITGNDGNEFTEPDELDKAQRELKLVERKKAFEEKERKRWRDEIKERLQEFYPNDRISIIRVSLNIKWDEVSESQNIVSPVEATPENPETPYPDRKLMPNGTLIISQNKRDERFRGNGFTPGGPTGTEKQLPPGYRDLDYQRSEYGNNDTITNYAYNSTERKIRRQPWEEQARSIAVAVDGIWKKGGIKEIKDGYKHIREYIPPSEEELRTLEELLKASILYKAVRGDLIEVRHLKKDRQSQFEEADATLTRNRNIREILLIVGIVAFALILVVVFYSLIRSEILRRRKMKEEELNVQQQMMRDAALRATNEEGTEVELSIDEVARREMLDNVINIARSKPNEVAQLLRSWLSDE